MNQNVSLEGTINRGSQDWMLPRNHSICHLQHTALLCFISCFNCHICINTGMKATAATAPLPVKASVTAARSPHWNLCLVFADLSNPMHLTQDRELALLKCVCSADWTSCNQILAPASRPHATVNHIPKLGGQCITVEERHQVCICTAPYTRVSTREGS